MFKEYIKPAALEQLAKQLTKAKTALGMQQQQEPTEGECGDAEAEGMQGREPTAQTAAAQDPSSTTQRAAAAAASATAGAHVTLQQQPAPTPLPSEPTTAAAAAPVAAAAAPLGAHGLPGPAFVTSGATVRDLIAAERQLLWLYNHKLQPSMADLKAFRAAMEVLPGLPADDVRLDVFWKDYDVSCKRGGRLGAVS